MVGSSILREVKSGDLKNGYVKSISGGKIKDIKEKIANLQFTPKTIITLAGGNDIDSDIEIEKVVSEYSVTLTETKTKFPDVKLVVAGLPPRHHSNEMRTKTKDYNEAMKKWCQVNNVSFIDNETLFEYRSGEVDTSSFVMSGATPAVHLTRPATIRMLKNIQQAVPELMLADLQHQGHSYADVLKKTPAEMRPNHENKDNRNRQPTYKYTPTTNYQRRPNYHLQQEHNYNYQKNGQSQPRGCYFCSETNHTMQQCKFGQKITCNFCKKLGHKEKFCKAREFSYDNNY